MLAERIDLEFHGAAVGATDFLVGQIDRQGRVRAALGIVEQFVEVFLGNTDRQHAVLEAVIVEDVAKRGRDDAADAEIEQRPRRMLAARTAAEIVAGNQHLGVAVARLVEDEIGILAAVVVVALLREQSLAKAGALDGLQILLRDDHVGIYIDDLQRRRDAFQRGELFHRSTSWLERTKSNLGAVVYRERCLHKRAKNRVTSPMPRWRPYRRRRGRNDARSRGSAHGERSDPVSRRVRPSSPGSAAGRARSGWAAGQCRPGSAAAGRSPETGQASRTRFPRPFRREFLLSGNLPPGQ